MNNHRFPVPLIPVTGKVLNGTNGPVLFGDLYDIAGSVSIGLFDADTNAIATGTGNGNVFYIGYSSEHTKDFLDKWFFGMQLPKGAPGWKFRGEDVFKFEYAEPQRAKAEKWVLGFDGTSGCNETTPTFECGKVYGVRIVASGSPVFRRWAKVLEHEIFSDPVCCGDSSCSTGCPDDKVDCKAVVKELASKINNHVELAQIGIKARAITSDYSAPSMNVNKYTVTVYDSGDAKALGAVQLQVGSLGVVTRVARNNDTAQSTYQYFGTAAAANFIPAVSFAVASCDVCPTGFTTSPAYDEYIVSRPLDGTEDLSTPLARTTFATTVATAYAAVDVATIATADVNAGTDVITETAHNLVTGQAVVYDDGGGAAITGLVDNTTYYVIKVDNNTFKVATTYANAIAGTAIDLTGTGNNAQTFTPAIGSTFLSQNGSVATISLKTGHGSSLSALLSDTATLVNSVGTTCTPAAATPVAWTVTNGVGHRDTREMCISLNRLDCSGGNRLAELTAFLANNPLYVPNSIELVSGTGCRDSYTASQYADGFSTDGCLSSEPAVFSDFGGYDNETWSVVPETPEAYDEDVKCGIEISAEIPERFLSDCAMELKDFWEDEPIRLEVSWIHDSYTGWPEDCVTKFPAAKRVQSGQVASGSGEWLLREYIKAGTYENFSCDYDNPRLRELLDSNRRAQIDRKAFYRIYYLQANIFRKAYNFGQHPETIEAMIAFKEGDPKAAEFELAFGSVLSKFGVSLKKR